MDMSRPAATLVPSLDAEVLTVLAGTTRPLTGREVGRLARRGSLSGVQKVLGRLADHGLVSVQEAGPALLYVLNRDHLVAPLVESLANLRGELFERIRQQLAAWLVWPVSAVLFGSAARGDGGLHSDVDVFLVRSDEVDADDAQWREQVAELAAAITRWTGNAASMIEASAEEARAMFERGEPVVRDLMRDAVPLAGESIADVLSGRAR
jgi:predicted nucleotidyltransferase